MKTIEDVRADWSHKRAVSGHKASFAVVALLAVGLTANAYIDETKDRVDSRNVEVHGGRIFRVGGVSAEHSFVSGALTGISIVGIVGAFGFSVRACDRYIRSAGHRNGSKDHEYNPNTYDRD